MTLTSSCLAPSSGHGSRADVLVRSVPDMFDLTALLEDTEKQLILKTLTATSGAQAEAARRMGLSRSALAYKLNKYGIRASEWNHSRRDRRQVAPRSKSRKTAAKARLGKGVRNEVLKGRTSLAQRFSTGTEGARRPSPGGTAHSGVWQVF